ncbi:MAG TPA: rhodanese-related sulfurtransferase, partial [Verrucomicrobiae bacterium]|nr:rhodanese-related sulfurtransferase [Verrucomicrobiae bacterium]
GTVGGDLDDLKTYVKQTKAYPAFKDVEFKWSDGRRDDFPRLSVKVRPEIVTFGVPDKIKVDRRGIVGGGKRLKPEQVHELVEERGDEVIFFDGRNAYEAAVGKFKDAVVTDARHTRDFPQELKKDKYQKLKSRPVVTYCTGGIRCEVLSMLMKEEGFEEVYQIDGGIAKYGEQYGDGGLWEGSLYVFDDRLTTPFTNGAVDIGSCSHCGAATSNYENCADKTCNDLILICEGCVPEQRYCVRHTKTFA